MLDRPLEPNAPIDIVRAVAAEYGVRSHRLLNPEKNRYLISIRNEAVRRVFLNWPDISTQRVMDTFAISKGRVSQIKKEVVEEEIKFNDGDIKKWAVDFFKEHDVDFKSVVRIDEIRKLRNDAIVGILENFEGCSVTAIARLFAVDHSCVSHAKRKRNVESASAK